MMKLPISLIAATSAILLSGCGPEPEERYKRALDSFEHHDLASARLHLISALKEQPNDPEMLLLLARTQIGMGDGEGATATLDALAKITAWDETTRALAADGQILRGQPEKALEIVAQDTGIPAYRARALAHIAMGDFAAAESALDAGLKQPGGKAQLQSTAARFHLGKGDFARARELSAKALENNPALLDALLVSGQIEAADRNLPAALKAYDQVLKVHNGNIDAMIGRIGVLGDMGHLNEARDDLGTLAEKAPNRPDILYLRARIATEEGKWQEARTILQPHENLLRTRPALQVIYAQALLNIGQVEQARNWIAPIVRQFPNQRLARRIKGESELRAGNPSDALDTLKILAERSDAEPQELALAAEAARATGDQIAGEYGRRAKLPSPQWIGSKIAKADKALREGRWSAAANSYGQILERSNQPNAIVLNNYAYAEGQLGNIDKAIALALQAVTLAPDNASILDTAGWLLVESGQDRQRGISLLRKAAEIAPNNATIAKHLAKAET